MINQINHQKISPNLEQNVNKSKVSSQPAANSTAQLKQMSKPPVSVPSIPVRHADALPSDKISASIVSFARFFSLPLKPQLLADIQRQSFLQRNMTESSPSSLKTPEDAKQAAALKQTAAAKQTALSLAAAAAESKGVRLSSASQQSTVSQLSSASHLYQNGLESYTEAIDPDSRRQNEDRRRKRDKNEKENLKAEEITADNLKKLSMDYSRENPIINIMNKLPEKNGRRWIVVPFDFSCENIDYYATMRILINDNQTLSKTINHVNIPLTLALDVLTKNENEIESEESRRLFVIEYAGNSDKKPFRISVIHQPELPEKSHPRYISELSRVFDIPSERIIIKNAATDFFPFEAELNEPPRPVDEAV